ncbi:increased recombination centers protein 6 [Scheffersomyces xylosifermentans]|uniref:increased recombination centers protein 6 n=1 Tax=Scheffersomyces xylosifermentans TaxID=1304137 RepID=UPI00315C9B3C
MIPNHVLILGAPNTGKLRVANCIAKQTDRLDRVPSSSHSGLILKTSVTTKYYSLQLNLLIDEYPENRSETVSDSERLQALEKWYNEFVSDECEELREVLDGIIFCIDVQNDHIDYIEKCLEIVGKIRHNLSDRDSEYNEWSGFLAIVGSIQDEKIGDERLFEIVEDTVISNGFEFIDLQKSGQNEYKEKTGKDRLVELLESHEWSHMDIIENKNSSYEQSKLTKANDMTKGLLEVEDEPETEGNDIDNEGQRYFGAVDSHEPTGDSQMDFTELMQKLQLARDNAQGLSEEERKIYADKIIAEVIDYI